MDTPNKSARFCSNILEYTTLSCLRSEKKKHEKLASLPYSGMKTFRIYSSFSLATFKCYQKGFICIPSSNVQKMRPFLVIFVEWFPWKPRPLRKFYFQFLVNILKLFKGAKFDHDQINEESVIRN